MGPRYILRRDIEGKGDLRLAGLDGKYQIFRISDFAVHCQLPGKGRNADAEGESLVRFNGVVRLVAEGVVRIQPDADAVCIQL